jgi:hypothetical protein
MPCLEDTVRTHLTTSVYTVFFDEFWTRQVGALSQATLLDERLVTEIACGPVTKQVDSSLPIRIQSVQALIALVWAVPLPAPGLLKALASAREILVLPPTSPGRHELVMLAHALVGALLRTEGIALLDLTSVLRMLAVTASATPEDGTHTHIHTRTHTYTHTHIYTHTHTNTHTHMHTNAHTHTHTQVRGAWTPSMCKRRQAARSGCCDRRRRAAVMLSMRS